VSVTDKVLKRVSELSKSGFKGPFDARVSSATWRSLVDEDVGPFADLVMASPFGEVKFIQDNDVPDGEARVAFTAVFEYSKDGKHKAKL